MHSEATLVERIEASIAKPRLIKVNAVHALAEQLQDSRNIVAEAVVSGVGEDGMPGLWPLFALERIAKEQIAGNRGFDELLRDIFRVDGSDQAQIVAGGLHVGRYGPGHGDGLFDGFVAVAVNQGDIAMRHAGHEDDAV